LDRMDHRRDNTNHIYQYTFVRFLQAIPKPQKTSFMTLKTPIMGVLG
jgi:hypothetical protein